MAAASRSIRNDVSEIRHVAKWVASFCDANGLEVLEHRLTLVLEELLTNVVAYGYDDDSVHSIDVCLNLDGGALTAVFIDDGRPFDPRDAPKPDLTGAAESRPVGGLGIHLVLATMDSVDYDRIDGRNRLTMTLSIP